MKPNASSQALNGRPNGGASANSARNATRANAAKDRCIPLTGGQRRWRHCTSPCANRGRSAPVQKSQRAQRIRPGHVRHKRRARQVQGVDTAHLSDDVCCACNHKDAHLVRRGARSHAARAEGDLRPHAPTGQSEIRARQHAAKSWTIVACAVKREEREVCATSERAAETASAWQKRTASNTNGISNARARRRRAACAANCRACPPRPSRRVRSRRAWGRPDRRDSWWLRR